VTTDTMLTAVAATTVATEPANARTVAIDHDAAPVTIVATANEAAVATGVTTEGAMSGVTEGITVDTTSPSPTDVERHTIGTTAASLHPGSTATTAAPTTEAALVLPHPTRRSTMSVTKEPSETARH
jgi:hypothetical protein